jgi:hypothetical protein
MRESHYTARQLSSVLTDPHRLSLDQVPRETQYFVVDGGINPNFTTYNKDGWTISNEFGGWGERTRLCPRLTIQVASSPLPTRS